MKTKLPLFLRSLIFLILFSLSFHFIQQLVREPYSSEVHVAEAIIEENESFDIVILGSSYAYCAFDPAIMQTVLPGATIHNLSIPNLSQITTYFLLRKMVAENRIPQVVIIEVSTANLNHTGIMTTLFFNNFSETWNPAFLPEILSFYSPQEYLSLMFPLLYQHENWQTPGLFDRNIRHLHDMEGYIAGRVSENEGYQNQGFRAIAPIISPEAYQQALILEKDTIPTPQQSRAIQKIINLSEESGFAVLFVMSPMVQAETGRAAQVEAFIKAQGVPFYDLNQTLASKTSPVDFYDPTHLNALGAVNASLALGQIIADEFERNRDAASQPYFEKLNIERIDSEMTPDGLLLRLIPTNPPHSLTAEWALFVNDGPAVAVHEDQTLAFLVPAHLLSQETLKMEVTVQTQDIDYPVTISFSVHDYH